MKMLKKQASLTLVLIILMASTAEAAQPAVGLGRAGSFAVLAGSGVTNTGSSVVKGDLGSSPTKTTTGFPPGKVQNGTINPSYTASGKSALVTAYNDAAGRTPVTTIGTELGGQTLTPGIYDSAAGTFGITGTLTLDAQGDTKAVWVFKMASTLTTASSSDVNLINGASQCRVYWQVGSSATLGTSSTLRGTIMALTSITVTTSARIFGRALARNGAVTLDSNTIDASACLPASSTTATTGTTGTDNASGQLPRTGAKLPAVPSIATAFALIFFGLFYNFLGSSSTRLAVAVRGYQPQRRTRRSGT